MIIRKRIEMEKILRKAYAYYKNELAGTITETDDGYIFQYDKDFIKKNIPIA